MRAGVSSSVRRCFMPLTKAMEFDDTVDEFLVPDGWPVAEISRDADGQVSIDVSGVELSNGFKSEVEIRMTEFARSVPMTKDLADAFRLVFTPEGDAVEVQMFDVGFSIWLATTGFFSRESA